MPTSTKRAVSTQVVRSFRNLSPNEIDDPELLTTMESFGRLGSFEWDQLLASDRILILSPAGAGKTYECQSKADALFAEGKPAFFFTLEALANTGLENSLGRGELDRFRRWCRDGNTIAYFFLDSFDELQLSHGSFRNALRRLADAISGQLHRAKIVVTSRPLPVDLETFCAELPKVDPQPVGDIKVETEARFRKLLKGELIRESRKPPPNWMTEDNANGVRICALTPLSGEQIKSIIAAQGVSDSAKLIEEVERKRAWEMARRPQELIEICSYWKEHGALGNRAQQVAEDIRRKLKEVGSRKKHVKLSEARALEGAERLALALALTRKRTIRFSDLSLDDLEQEAPLDPSLILSDWNEAERAELLQRPLFGFASYGRVRFHHRSASEYLAAQRLQRFVSENHMPRSALFRLLFGERYGEELVFPSMRAIATWLSLNNEGVFDEMLSREPEALMDDGDPESFSISARNRILSAYVERYRSSEWRGVRIPYPQVMRFAAPELSPTVKKLWRTDLTSPEVKELLIDLIQAGRMSDCLDIAEEIARDSNARHTDRVTAITALAEMTDAGRLDAITRSLIDPDQPWPSDVKEGVIGALFPKHMTVEEFALLLSQIDADRDRVGGLSWALPRLVDAMELDPSQRTDLRGALTQLLSDGAFKNEHWPHYVSKFQHLSPSLALLCDRELAAQRALSNNLAKSIVFALRFKVSEYGNEKPTEELLRQIHSIGMPIRKALYVAESAFCIEHMPTKDDDLPHNVIWGGSLASLDHNDYPWLIEICVDASLPQLTRDAAFRNAIYLIRNAGEPIENRVAEMRGLASDRESWTKWIEPWLAPPTGNLDHEAREARYAKERKAREAEERRATLSWEKWRKRVIADPDAYFAKTSAEGIAHDFYQVLQRADDRTTTRAHWSRAAIVEFFSEEIADRVASAFGEYWRTIKIPLRSERPIDERNLSWSHWHVGLAGVYAEADLGTDWATHLSDQDAEYALRYAPLELNGIPPWLDDVVLHKPQIADNILGTELSAQLSDAVSFNFPDLISDFARASEHTQRFFAPRIWQWLSTSDFAFDGETEQTRMYEHIERAIELRFRHGGTNDTGAFIALAVQQLNGGLTHPFAVLWSTALLRLHPETAVELLESGLKKLCDEERYKFSERLFAAIGDRRHARFSPDLKGTNFTPGLLFKLVRLAYSQIKLDDDTDRVGKGTYSPTTRDDAQDGRGAVLSALLASQGPNAWHVKQEMRKDQLFGHYRDRLDQYARETAATEAEGPSLRDADLAAIEKYGEAPEADRDGMFRLMMDRLFDLQHDLAAHEFSERPMLARIDKEAEMQVWLAKRLQEKANGAYRVDREAMVINAKETDIRLLSVRTDQQAVIELKLANNGYSYPDLLGALENQLVGQYMKHDNCRAGCLLITMAETREWQHPETGSRVSFRAVIEMLRARSQALMSELNFALKIDVVGVDLTQP
jgi:hypothetical protein